MRNTPKPTGPPPDLITVATLTMEYPHMQDSDTSGGVGGGILKAGDLRAYHCNNIAFTMRNTPKPTGPPPGLITVATLTMEYPHMQDSDTSGSVGGGILKAGDLQ
ncbi:hypothetical protein CEXT_149241 [Caerostris extrusa]|uniref:Uncharacterized protein n=1 Tax=Caerostris extrusa TaxID=172846 RepID=A0AAV4U7E8_CAEEX|nr:hypothetical protein CEXT_149241 [Caerostris extrusa]